MRLVGHHWWHVVEDRVVRRLSADDDARLWAVVIDVVVNDAAYLVSQGEPANLVVGCCSSWRRPHQTRWTADGGFAWPEGYDSTKSLPEHDWEETWSLTRDGLALDAGEARVTLRISVPARSVRHAQAAVHTVWTPGSPVKPRELAYQFYGFRRDGDWRCTATSGDELYDRVNVASVE